MGGEVWVFPANNTDRHKDRTGHRHTDTQAEPESGHTQLAQVIGMPSRFRTPCGKRRRRAREDQWGPKAQI